MRKISSAMALALTLFCAVSCSPETMEVESGTVRLDNVYIDFIYQTPLTTSNKLVFHAYGELAEGDTVRILATGFSDHMITELPNEASYVFKYPGTRYFRFAKGTDTTQAIHFQIH